MSRGYDEYCLRQLVVGGNQHWTLYCCVALSSETD